MLCQLQKLRSISENNRYGDVDYMCLISGYYIAGVHKDRNKVRRLTPGGRKTGIADMKDRRKIAKPIKGGGTVGQRSPDTVL